jgi:signal transduction histidine kinase/CheY-like chemotaxis protein
MRNTKVYAEPSAHYNAGGGGGGDDDESSALSFGKMPRWKYIFWEACLGLSEQERKFQEFMSKENSSSIHASISFVGTIVTLSSILKATLSGNYSPELQLFFIQRALILPPLLLHLYAAFQQHRPNWRPLPFKIIYIGDALMLSYALCFGIYLFGLATAEGCSDVSGPKELMCDHRVHVDSIVPYVTVPMMFSVLVKCRHRGVLVLCVLIQTFFLGVVVAIVEPTVPNATAVFVVFVAQSCMAFDCDTYSRRLYIMITQSHAFWQAKVEADNENVVMEMQSSELRFLIGNVAHDLKTPLQAFSYELEVLKKSPAMSSSAPCKESLMLLESVCSFMLMTINRAIDYTKVTSGIKLKPSLSTVDVKGVFEWVKKCVAHTGGGESSSVSVVVEPFSPDICQCIITDEQWLMENLLCLISNAQKFTARGSIVVRYSLCADRSGNHVDHHHNTSNDDAMFCVIGQSTDKIVNERKSLDTMESDRSDNLQMVMIEVVDEGIGISDEMQAKLFKPFKQAMRRAGGTGLGIYSLSKRVESLGGACGVSSRSDGKCGARFWFTLPYTPDESAVAFLSHVPTLTDDEHTTTIERRGNNDPLEALSYQNAGVKILLVEDSQLIQKTCTRAFQREGIHLDVANNGLECLEMVLHHQSTHGFKVLLMDVNMPLMDGLEATQRIREWERERGGGRGEGGDVGSDCSPKSDSSSSNSRLVIIGLSANSDSASAQEALDAGMDRFICKPLKMSVLKECLADFGFTLETFKSV